MKLNFNNFAAAVHLAYKDLSADGLFADPLDIGIKIVREYLETTVLSRYSEYPSLCILVQGFTEAVLNIGHTAALAALRKITTAEGVVQRITRENIQYIPPPYVAGQPPPTPPKYNFRLILAKSSLQFPGELTGALILFEHDVVTIDETGKLQCDHMDEVDSYNPMMYEMDSPYMRRSRRAGTLLEAIRDERDVVTAKKVAAPVVRVAGISENAQQTAPAPRADSPPLDVDANGRPLRFSPTPP